VDAILQIFQFLLEPNDFTKPLILLVFFIGVFLFGLFTYITRRQKQKVVERQKALQLSKDLKNSQDLTELLVVLALIGVGKK